MTALDTLFETTRSPHPLLRRYLRQRLSGCLSGIPAAIAVFLLAYAISIPWLICAALGALIELTAIYYFGISLSNLRDGTELATIETTLQREDKIHTGNLCVPGARRYVIFLTSSRTDVEGAIRLFPSETSAGIPAIQIEGARGDVSPKTEISGITLELRPGWRRFLRSGDFEPIRILFSASTPPLTFQFKFFVNSKLPRRESVEIVAVIAKQ